MLNEKIVSLFEAEEFEKLEDLINDSEVESLVEAFNKINVELLSDIIPKLPPKKVAEVFIRLSKETQIYLTENVSDIDFKPVLEELLDEDIETELDKEVFTEVMLKAQADSRHEKLLEIIDNISNKKFGELKPLLSEMEPIDVAEIMNDLENEDDAILFRLLPKDLASETFINMNSETQEALIKTFTDKELSSIIDDLYLDDTVDLIEEMPSNVVVRIIKLSSPETRESINKLLGFPKDSAGTIMTTELVTLRAKMTAGQALEKMRRQALDKETIYTCYVTDDEKHLLGIVSAKDIIIHDPNDIVGDFMETNYVSAYTHTDKEEVSNMLSKYDLLAIPIVDNENRINGIVTIDDAIDVIQDEVSEDISKMAAITPTGKPYLETNVFRIYKSRVPWLLVLLISATFTGLIINNFESTLNDLSPLLFACIPMLMDSGGNAGSQASVTIIRSLALGEVEFKDVLKVLFKEIRVAVLLALTLAVACFTKLQLIDKLIFGYDYNIKISLVVSIALFATICIAKIVGAFLPLLAKKCKLDPAVVASPFITTIVDAISLIIYCTFAVAIL